jgi:hypothetical protein
MEHWRAFLLTLCGQARYSPDLDTMAASLKLVMAIAVARAVLAHPDRFSGEQLWAARFLTYPDYIERWEYSGDRFLTGSTYWEAFIRQLPVEKWPELLKDENGTSD